MDILLDSRFLKISEIQDTKGGLQTLPSHSNVASVVWAAVAFLGLWIGQNTGDV